MKRDRCPMDWHLMGATRGQTVTFTRGYTSTYVDVTPADVERVLGWNPDVVWDDWPDDDMCATHDDVRRMTHPAQASKPHPPIKPNRRKTHR